MSEVTTIEIGELKFYSHPLPGLTGALLEKQITSKVFGYESYEEVGGFNYFVKIMSSFSDSELTEFLKKLLSSTKFVDEEGQKALSNEASINKCFTGKIDSLWKLCYRVMEVNHFGPFVLAVLAGWSPNETGLLEEAESDQENIGTKLENSET